MTTITETEATPTDVAPEEPTQYTFPEGWTFPSHDPQNYTGESEERRIVYVNTVRAGNRDHWVGTFRYAEAGRGGDGWSCNGRRVYGAVINPTVSTGRHYLVFGRFVVRYDDEFNASSRHNSAIPFSIICDSNGEPWYFPNDSIASLEGTDYITLSEETVSNLGQAEATETAEEPAVPATWEDGADTITMGFARQEEDGTILLNPAPVIGDVYLMWDSALETEDGARQNLHSAVYLGGGAIEDAFFVSGYWYKYYGRSEWNQVNGFQQVPNRWVKMGWGTDYTEPVNTVTSRIERKVNLSKEELVTFNKATNKLALKHSWCSTYEGIITPLGMKSRYHGYWYVDVAAKTCITRDEVDRYQARDLLSYLGLSGTTITNLSMEATVSIRVGGLEADTTEAAKELVTDERIQEALKKQYPSTEFTALTDIVIGEPLEDRDGALAALREANDE